MMENESLFEYIDQQYVDISVLANTIIEDAYAIRETGAALNDTGNVHLDQPDQGTKPTPDELIKSVHGGRNLHKGALRTRNALNKFFPGHGISYKYTEEWIATCPTCQKDRLAKEKEGNNTLIVIVEHFTKIFRN